MQIVRGNEYKKTSEQQRTYNTRERAPRGIIYSSDGQPIAGNKFIYTVLFSSPDKNLTPSEYILKELSKIIGREVKVPQNQVLNKGKAIKLVDNLTFAEMLKIQEKRIYLPGISVAEEPHRVYYHQSTGHLTGYTSEINDKSMFLETLTLRVKKNIVDPQLKVKIVFLKRQHGF
ncbi:hypothetical protein, partial [Candidatus Endomicrobiellum agilis]|uniref:hypothetical protein n=1 Tax=Candidatus Endomicrobiellum agilis TaxID=3238957 RepID=UPI00357BEA25|nr:hypothetical protein [Endomicrobium sp.]